MRWATVIVLALALQGCGFRTMQSFFTDLMGCEQPLPPAAEQP